MKNVPFGYGLKSENEVREKPVKAPWLKSRPELKTVDR